MLDGIEIDVADPYRDSAKLNYLRGIIFGGEQGICQRSRQHFYLGSTRRRAGRPDTLSSV